jgi:hypothetical protein
MTPRISDEGRRAADAVANVIDERDRRALTETLFIKPDAPDLYLVHTASGDEYVVDTREPACTCPDFQYRDVKCKHIRRVELETDERSTEGIAADIDVALERLDREIAALAAKRAEVIRLQSALDQFTNR